ncbi:MAG: rhomboid family intramembrane serine protease [Chloroflexi bacterium]|nr:rhomboid family intramembrane serine protease [Chloroflexota bacterium]
MAYRGRQSFVLTPVGMLIVGNIVMFVATVIKPEALFFLGLQPAGFLARPWTLVTSLFIHSGFGHVAVNMLTLYFFGRYLSNLIGEGKLLMVYFGGGILGSILYLLLAPPFSIAVGASGAIFSLGGALAVIRPRTPVFIFPIPVPVPLWIAVIGGFLLLSFLPSIAWQAHLGGIVFGLVAGYIFKRSGHYRYF